MDPTIFVPTFEMFRNPKSFPLGLTKSFGAYEGQHATRGAPMNQPAPSYWQPVAPENTLPVRMIYDGQNAVRF